jgi:tripartite-type tricarboxylate transporter receptor subunit TctC
LIFNLLQSFTMQNLRNFFVALLALLWSAAALSADYPNKPIKLIVPFPPGGATDIIARVVAQRLSIDIGQTVVAENKAGAAGVIGSEMAARSAPDGYTIVMTTSSTHSIGPLLNPNIPYSPTKDFTPIIYLASSPQVLVVPLSAPYDTLQGLIDYAKKNPGKLNYSSSGNGGIPHLSGARFAVATGIQLTHVPYKGTALAMPDLMAGRIDVMFDSMSSGSPHVIEGKVKALGVTSLKPSPVLPKVPAIVDTVPGYDSLTWFGVFGPAGMPKDVVEKLNRALNQTLKDPGVLAQMAKLGFDAEGGTPEDCAAKMNKDTIAWKKVIEDGKITLEQ